MLPQGPAGRREPLNAGLLKALLCAALYPQVSPLARQERRVMLLVITRLSGRVAERTGC